MPKGEAQQPQLPAPKVLQSQKLLREEQKRTKLMIQNKLVPVRQAKEKGLKKRGYRAADYTGKVVMQEANQVVMEVSGFRTK